MRKTLYAIISFLAVPFLFSSCLDDDNTTYEYSSDALISAFSINDLEREVPSKTSKGEDTTLIVTVLGSKYSFIIDQTENRIYNSDSLPVGTNVSKVSLNLSIIGYSVTYEKNQKDTLWTSTDSLDFSKPVNFKVYAYDGTTRSYKAQINVHKQEPDSLEWKQLEGTNFSVAASDRQKAVFFQDRIYVFTENGNQVQVTSTGMTDGKNWTALQSVGIDGADYSSVIAFKDSNEDEKLYLLAQNKLYSSADGVNWTKIETKTKSETEPARSITINRLFAASPTHLYGISDGVTMNSENAEIWNFPEFFKEENEQEIERYKEQIATYFPTQNISYSACKLATNSDIERLIVVGERNVASDTTAVVWSKLSTEDRWTCYNQSADNIYGCPKLKELAVIHYDDKLYAFGGEKDFTTTLPVKAFGVLYESVDHGITWKERKKMVMLPEEFIGRTNHFSYVVDSDNYIWIMWSGRSDVWKGKINRLGFVEKQE